MKISGLTIDKNIQRYIEEAYGLSLVSSDPIPLFKNNESFFLGGTRSFYTLVEDYSRAEMDSLMSSLSSKYENIESLISLSLEDSRAKLVNYVLDTRDFNDVESRLDRYEKKTRNLVRKSYNNDFTFYLETGKIPVGFHDLYESSMKRLGGMVKDKEWFEKMENMIPQNIITLSLFDKGRLIASNLCLFTRDYILLMFNISDPPYWEYAVNDRLYDELIKWSIEHKVMYVDFGPGVAGDSSHNHFKEGFGAEKRYILNIRYGSLYRRIKVFLNEKKRNLKLRLNKIKR